MKIFTTALVPTLVLVGSLGASAVVAAPANAATKAKAKAKPVAAKTYSGTIKSVAKGKDVFALTSGKGHYTVDYSKMTKFTKGAAKDLKDGLKVSVTGKLTKSVLTATSIKA